jgi:Family of unknown function (DUF5996)
MIGQDVAEAEDLWPELPWRDWAPTISTLHMWTQVVGKVRLALAPPLNHWWHVPLYVSSRGLTTSPIPFGARQFQVDFDVLRDRLDVTDSDGGSFTMPLEPQSVAQFYRQFMAGLRGLGIDVRIWTRPVEVADAIPFETDEEHAAYDPRQARSFWRGLLQADRVMKTFRSRFVGKASPVHFFWGSFDLATTRFSGRPAPLHPGGVPNCPTWVMQEAYSREEHSVGWWPLSQAPGPAFYAYVYPEPDGFRAASVGPAGASFDPGLGEFVLPYDAVRQSADPDWAVLEFFQATYEAGANLGGWDRASLEPASSPARPPDRPWSTIGPTAPPEADSKAEAGRASSERAHRHGSRHDRARDR